MNHKLELMVDDERLKNLGDMGTGILVMAKSHNGEWLKCDIYHLEASSLLSWLRSDGGKNPLAEDTVGVIFGHGHIVDRADEY